VIAGGVYAVKGSANRFPPGGRQQENGPSLSPNAVSAAVAAPFLGPNHDLLLKQMAGTRLDVTALLGPGDSGRGAPLPSAPAA
jgi:hypothetical protein